MDNGWIKSYRSKWTHPVFRNLLEAAMWGWLCETALWEKRKVRHNGLLVELDRGQLITTINFMSKGFGIGQQVTRTFLENLENEGMINKHTNKHGTIITICNYNKYQEFENTANKQDNKPLTNSQQTGNNNNKEVKEYKNIKKEYIPPEGVSLSVWEDFKKLRKVKKAPITETAMNGIQREADKVGWTLEQALSECCARGWQSFKAEYINQKGKLNAKRTSHDELREYLDESRYGIIEHDANNDL